LHVLDKSQEEKDEAIQEEKAFRYLQGWQEKFRRNGGSVDIRVSVGVPSQQINEIAEDEGATLIAMPARGVGLVKLVMGRTADAVVRRSSTPVLLFKIY
jgi:nucleotide-binding universal stress UspA family protein